MSELWLSEGKLSGGGTVGGTGSQGLRLPRTLRCGWRGFLQWLWIQANWGCLVPNSTHTRMPMNWLSPFILQPLQAAPCPLSSSSDNLRTPTQLLQVRWKHRVLGPRVWFCWSEWSSIIYILQISKWCTFYWSLDHTLRTIAWTWRPVNKSCLTNQTQKPSSLRIVTEHASGPALHAPSLSLPWILPVVKSQLRKSYFPVILYCYKFSS